MNGSGHSLLGNCNLREGWWGEEKKLPAQLSGELHKKVKHKNAGLSPSQESLFIFCFKAFLYCGTDTPSL